MKFTENHDNRRISRTNNENREINFKYMNIKKHMWESMGDPQDIYSEKRNTTGNQQETKGNKRKPKKIKGNQKKSKEFKIHQGQSKEMKGNQNKIKISFVFDRNYYYNFF